MQWFKTAFSTVDRGTPRAKRRIAVSVLLLCGLALCVSDAQAADTKTLDSDPHLMGWWKFDEEAGTNSADSSKHDRDARLEGGVTFDKGSVPGAVGKAVVLDGKANAIRIPDYKGVVGISPRTISLWIKTKSNSGDLLSWGTRDMGMGWTLGFVRRYVGLNNGGYFYMASEVQDDTWRHVAVVVAEADLPNFHDDVTLYLDGEIAEIHKIGLLDLWPIDTGDERDVAIGEKFKGAVDELRIYDRALTDEEIATLYEAAK